MVSSEEIIGVALELGHLCINSTSCISIVSWSRKLPLPNTSDTLDIRYNNILRAPQFSQALPSLPSPVTKRTYEWRMVDFEMAIKCNSSIMSLRPDVVEALLLVWQEVEMGYYDTSECDDTDSSDSSGAKEPSA